MEDLKVSCIIIVYILVQSTNPEVQKTFLHIYIVCVGGGEGVVLCANSHGETNKFPLFYFFIIPISPDIHFAIGT